MLDILLRFQRRVDTIKVELIWRHLHFYEKAGEELELFHIIFLPPDHRSIN
ncbi:hypothetical protein Cassandra_0290 [Pseudomonas phage Cassandra]|uniref:Uncharacterized protein n=1 Tax=Pseudomonas phage vB_PaeM_PA5oct TaxID=2163605 RepID=A0A4Y5JUR2_9CAUD|nr:hypothetical protein PQE65_gp027 [Pseudomonas phage vB_PaeM_PA5oct]WPK38966.1 hypothetical protein Cassandra_0290 [Pseudomonas phage Cassandra]WPK39486.1 hypothetical protein Deiofobo_0289 [Pseudomonas phage Deifobo]WPK39999.1 hypothetical protein ETTORE_0290 [Pseudomonas phage Ettore]WPK40520.1 hypothetical protein Paride_0290 [Pseudomonas phage Paride]QCG75911.1 hypothetical protein EST35_0027 [Pseudomonas phage vB_PaeM_PA5oct]